MSEMSSWIRSVALIRKFVGTKAHWLARRVDASDHHLQFIHAPRLERESFRETIKREVAWVLKLDAERDFLVSNMAQLNMEFIDRLPGQDEETHVAVSFYIVNMYRRAAFETVQRDPSNRWLTSREVCEGITDSGEKLDPRIKELLDRAQVINAWD